MNIEMEGAVIATITLNPCIDEHITVPGLILDEVNRWTKLHRYAGGKGIDVSRAIHEMGGATMAYGFVGGPEGRALEILLDEAGVPFSFTPIARETRTNFIITDTKTRRQTRLDAPGPHITKRELERFYRKIEQISPLPDLIVASGSLPPGVPATIYYDIIQQAKSQKIRTILDCDGKWFKEGVKAKPFLVKPNVHEAEGLLETELPTEEAIVKAALSLVEMGIEIVVISRGKNGLIAASKKKIIKAVPPLVKNVVSAIGAGDCTVAGLALKLVNNESLTEACRLAIAMGTACVLTPGTALCRQEDVEKLLPQVKVWEIPASQWSKTCFPADSNL